MGNYKKDGTNQQEFIATPEKLSRYIIEESLDIFGKENITEVLEPSAGAGDFTKIIREYLSVDILQYDLYPQSEDIIEQDFLKLKLDYKKGRICIMNPPFNKAIKFIDKAMLSCDYCSCICGMNTIINVDEYKYDYEKIFVIQNQPFIGGLKVDICIMFIKNKGI
jgi:16S rRNA A1518/A1519 N6-dimethyltransferase RsmA/KsgA/DIM1 with predicted DNA glycosylase/AP lyase activity